MGTSRSFNWRRPLRGRRCLRETRSGPRQWWEAAEEYPMGMGENPESDDCFDPLGSYTGISEDEDGVPEQDADDL